MTPPDVKLFVFPLDGVVLYPSTHLPLNIFEPRYIQMVKDSVETATPIAMSLENPIGPKSAHVRKQGVVVGYGNPDVIHRRPDGSMVILLKGKGRARIKQVTHETPYIKCTAEQLSDLDDMSEANQIEFQRLKRIFLKWVDANVNEIEQRQSLLNSLITPRAILEALCMVLIRDSDIQQSVLEMSDINERIRFIKFMV